MEVEVERRTDELGPEEGGGPPFALPWTLVVDGDEAWSADLEHGAPLPCVGDRIEVIGDDGARHSYRVREIVHTIQASASDRPPVSSQDGGPNALVTGPGGRRRPRAHGLVRAGLPRVFVSAEE